MKSAMAMKTPDLYLAISQLRLIRNRFGSTRSQVRILSPRFIPAEGFSKISTALFYCDFVGPVGQWLDRASCRRGCRACFAIRNGGLGSDLLQAVTGSCGAVRAGRSASGFLWPKAPASCLPKGISRVPVAQEATLVLARCFAGACMGL
jgi:hypothetical protein